MRQRARPERPDMTSPKAGGDAALLLVSGTVTAGILASLGLYATGGDVPAVVVATVTFVLICGILLLPHKATWRR